MVPFRSRGARCSNGIESDVSKEWNLYEPGRIICQLSVFFHETRSLACQTLVLTHLEQMPRRPTSDEAMRAARFFLEGFIERTDSQDHILPKNDTFSPFSGFCRVFPQFSKKKDGGSATDGVSRAAFNKICLEYFEEGMRKPARNGNPGALEANLAQQRRHFLRGRWRDPSNPRDLAELKKLWSSMSPEQTNASIALLEDFSRHARMTFFEEWCSPLAGGRWKPGPAGRGGERLTRKRGSDSEEESEDSLPSHHTPPAPKLSRTGDVRGDAAHLELLCKVAFGTSDLNSDKKPPLAPSSVANTSLPNDSKKDLAGLPSDVQSNVEKHSWNVKSQDSPSNRSPCVQPKLAWPVNAAVPVPPVNTPSSAAASTSKTYKPPGSVASILETPPLVPQVLNVSSALVQQLSSPRPPCSLWLQPRVGYEPTLPWGVAQPACRVGVCAFCEFVPVRRGGDVWNERVTTYQVVCMTWDVST
eukprot:754040-Hanusia_phi.AAC.1